MAAKSKSIPRQSDNPLIGIDEGETIESVHNVLEFLTWNNSEGNEETEQMADGRNLILRCCTAALQNVMNVSDR